MKLEMSTWFSQPAISAYPTSVPSWQGQRRGTAAGEHPQTSRWESWGELVVLGPQTSAQWRSKDRPRPGWNVRWLASLTKALVPLEMRATAMSG